MEVIENIPLVARWRGCACVPMMGALHEGHLALIRRACRTGRTVVVSIFVNPAQFGPDEDFERYPRDFEGDVVKAREAGADAVFAPSVDVMYPPDETIAAPSLPEAATVPQLEDACRPGHLEGVCRVVARLFDLIEPGCAVFGEKDYQQLKVIEAMVAGEPQRWPGLEIIPHPTVREPDGLALSTRNQYLSETDRARALGLSRALFAAREIASPGRDVRRIEEQMRAILVRHRVAIDYAVVRDAESLLPVETIHHPVRALVAAKVGDVRLIDNLDLLDDGER